MCSDPKVVLLGVQALKITGGQIMTDRKPFLDYVYGHEDAQSEQVFLPQPVDGGKVAK